MEQEYTPGQESLIESNWEILTVTAEVGENALAESVSMSKEDEQYLARTEATLRDPVPLVYAQERDLAQALPQYALRMVTAARARICLGLFIATKLNTAPLMSDVCDALCDAFLTGESQQTSELAYEAIKGVIAELPPIDSINFMRGSRATKLGLALIESVAPRLTAGVTSRNIGPSVHVIQMVLRHLGYLMRNHTKFANIGFLGDYFNTGIELGKGSYANVFLGRHVRTADVVAIKVMEWDKLTHGKPKLAEMLNNEIKIMRSADSASIIHLYDVVREGNRLNLVLEYCSGGNLEEYLEKHGPLDEEQVCKWLKDLASGLRFLHNRNIIHRDLKPGNLLLTSDHHTATMKITDFTFARFLEPGDMAASMVGTPLYMAPEVLRRTSYTEKADLWSVGVILYQMIAGKLPFKGATYYELMSNIETGRISWPEYLDVSADLKDLVLSLLKKDPNLRISWPEFFSHTCVLTSTSISISESIADGSVLITPVCDAHDLDEANKENARLRKEMEQLQAELAQARTNIADQRGPADMDSVSISSYDAVSTASVIVTTAQPAEPALEEVQLLKAELAAAYEAKSQAEARLQVAEARIHGLKAAGSTSGESDDHPWGRLQDKHVKALDKLVATANLLAEREKELDAERMKSQGLFARIKELETDLEVCRVALDQENRERAGGSGWRNFVSGK